jgi:Tfp pilus assembly protein FimT
MRPRVVSARLSGVSQNGMLGLTTLELVVSLGIILVVSAISIPAIVKAVRIYQLNDAASQVAGILKLTRFEAIRLNKPVSCVNLQTIANGPARLWSDRDGDGVEDATEKQILLGATATLVPAAAVPDASALAAAVGVPSMTSLNPASDSVKFDQRGAASPAGVYVIYVGNTSATDGGFRAVVLLPSGSVQIWTDAGSASAVWQQLS